MTNEKILKLLNEEKYEELKKEIKREIMIKSSKNPNIYKAIISLSKYAKKITYNKDVCGACYFDSYTYILSPYYLLRINENVKNLEMINKITMSVSSMEKLLTIKSDYEKINIDYFKNKILDGKTLIQFNNYYFNKKHLSKVIKCFKEINNIYINKEFIFIESDNIKAIVCCQRRVNN